MTQAPNDIDSLADQLDEVLELVRENNKILKAMRRDALIMGTLKTLIWVVLIVASFYFSYQFLQPYLGMMEGMQQQGQDYGALFEQYKGLLGQ